MTLALQTAVVYFLAMILVLVAQELLWRHRELCRFLSRLAIVLFVIAVVSGAVALLLVIGGA